MWLPVANDSRSEDAAGVGAILDTVDPILDAVIIATQLPIARSDIFRTKRKKMIRNVLPKIALEKERGK